MADSSGSKNVLILVGALLIVAAAGWAGLHFFGQPEPVPTSPPPAVVAKAAPAPAAPSATPPATPPAASPVAQSGSDGERPGATVENASAPKPEGIVTARAGAEAGPSVEPEESRRGARARSRVQEDARACLDFDENRKVMVCAEAFR